MEDYSEADEYDAILESMVYRLDISDDEKAIVLDKSDAVFKGYGSMRRTCYNAMDSIDVMFAKTIKLFRFIDDDVYKDIRTELKDHAKDTLTASIFSAEYHARSISDVGECRYFYFSWLRIYCLTAFSERSLTQPMK